MPLRGEAFSYSRDDREDCIAIAINGGGYVGFYCEFKFSKDKAELLGVDCFE